MPKNPEAVQELLALMGEGATLASTSAYSPKPVYDEQSYNQVAAEKGIPASKLWRTGNVKEAEADLRRIQDLSLEAMAKDIEAPGDMPAQLLAQMGENNSDPTMGNVPIALLEVLGPEVSELPPCQSEDDENCYWDATTMGNGRGESFIQYNGETYYYSQYQDKE